MSALSKFLVYSMVAIMQTKVKTTCADSFKIIYGAFFFRPIQDFAVLPALYTIKSIIEAEEKSVKIYTFPDDISQVVKQTGLDNKILSPEDLSYLYHEDSLNFEYSKLKDEAMLIRVDMYKQFLRKHCCGVHIIFTDLDQLFLSHAPLSEFLGSKMMQNWDLAHVHKGHGNNAGLFLVRSKGIIYGENFFSKVLNIYNSSTIRSKSCKGAPCTKGGGEQLAIDELIGNFNGWNVNMQNWYIQFEGGVILNLDARIFNAVPGRFEVNSGTKVMHFMGYRKKCMGKYIRMYQKYGFQAILRLEGFKPKLHYKHLRKLCKHDQLCQPCTICSKRECDAALMDEFNVLKNKKNEKNVPYVLQA